MDMYILKKKLICIVYIGPFINKASSLCSVMSTATTGSQMFM